MDPNPADVTSRPTPPGKPRRSQGPPATSYASPSSSPQARSNHSLQEGGNHAFHDSPGNISTFDAQATTRAYSNDPSSNRISSASLASNLQLQSSDEEEFGGLSRQDLFLGMLKAKEEIDRLDALVSSQTLEIETLRAGSSDSSGQFASFTDEIAHLKALIRQREGRIDELTADQERVEDDLYQKLGTVERLKTKAEETDRKLADEEKKFRDLVKTNDKEREYFQDQEALYKSQHSRLTREQQDLQEEVTHLRETVESLMQQSDEAAAQAGGASETAQPRSPRPVRPPTDASAIGNDKQALKEEIEQLRKTLTSHKAAMIDLRASLATERNRASGLDAEKRELESILTGDTLRHLLKGGRTTQQRLGLIRSSTGSSSQGDSISEVSEEAEAGEESAEEALDLDKTATPKASRKNAPRSSAGRRKRSSVPQVPEALGEELAELGSTQSDTAEGETSTDELRKLRSEVSRLQGENKHFSTYISKILNRIMALEGFERVLAADSLGAEGDKTWRGSRSGSSAARKPRSRMSILPIAGSTNESGSARMDRISSLSSTSSASGLSLRPIPAVRTGSASQVAADNPSQGSGGAKARASVDWRNLRMPWSSSGDSQASSNPHLRPFSLSTAATRLDNPPATPSTGTSASSPPPVPEKVSAAPAMAGSISTQSDATVTSNLSSARRIDSNEEVEDDADEQERQRLRTLLQMEGIEIPEHQLKSPPIGSVASPVSPTVGTFGAFFSRVMGSSTSPNANTNAPLPGSSAPSRSNTGIANDRLSPFNLKDSSATSNRSSTSNLSDAGSSSLTEYKSDRPRRPAARQSLSAAMASAFSRAVSGESASGEPDAPAASASSDDRAASDGGQDSAAGLGIATRPFNVSSSSPYLRPSSRSSTASRSPTADAISEEGLGSEFRSPSPAAATTGKAASALEEEQPTIWRKTFKRMSMLGGEPAPSPAASGGSESGK